MRYSSNIVKFMNFKNKAAILGNAKNLAECSYSISEDFCKNTNAIRKKLLAYGKNLSNRTNVPIETCHINYKSLTVLTNKNRYNITYDYINSHMSSWHNIIKE